MMILKKKTLAYGALISGAIIGFVGVTAIDFACHKSTPLNKMKPKVDPRIEKYLPWLKQQHFETWEIDRKSTRLNSSHVSISYADFCLKKKKVKMKNQSTQDYMVSTNT